MEELVASVSAQGPPDVRWIVPPPAAARRLGLLPGSFNPPTSAHLALARAGRAAGLDAVAYLLSKRTVDKERVTGLELPERLHLLADLARADGDALAFLNRGLYVDIASTVRAALPRVDLVFLVGHDKIVQIFDPRYYDDRERALQELFGLARFLVAPRADAGGDELAALLAEPANAPFADRVAPLALDERYRDASSTTARAGGDVDLPPGVRAYLERERPFG